jgi:hypothetical protein
VYTDVYSYSCTCTQLNAPWKQVGTVGVCLKVGATPEAVAAVTQVALAAVAVVAAATIKTTVLGSAAASAAAVAA